MQPPVDILEPQYAKQVIDEIKYDLASIIHTSWYDYHTQYAHVAAIHDSTCVANNLFCHNVHYARKYAVERSLKTHEDGRFFLLRLDESVWCRFKKMDVKRRTSNVATGRQDDIHQQQLEIPGFEPIHLVDVGYVPNPTWSNYEKILIVLKKNNKHVEWEITIVRGEAGLEVQSDFVVGDLFAATEEAGTGQQTRKRFRAKSERKASSDDE